MKPYLPLSCLMWCLVASACVRMHPVATYRSGSPFLYAVTIVQEGQRTFAPGGPHVATLYGTGGEVLGRGVYDGRLGLARVPYAGGGHPRFLLVERPGYYVAGLEIDADPVISVVPLWVELRPGHVLRHPPANDLEDVVTVTVTSHDEACRGAGISVFWWTEDGRELDRTTIDAQGMARLRRVSSDERPRFLLAESTRGCQVTGLAYEEGATDYPLTVEPIEIR